MSKTFNGEQDAVLAYLCKEPSLDFLMPFEQTDHRCSPNLERVPEEGLCIPHIARLLYDAALSSLMFGYMPTLSLSCLRSLKAPSSQPKCGDPNCKQPGRCRGNRLEYKLGSMWSSLPHHKNQKRLDSKPIEVRLPSELEDLLHVYVEKGLPVFAGDGMDHMFMDLKGRPMMVASKMSSYWSGHSCSRLGISKVFHPTGSGTSLWMRGGPGSGWRAPRTVVLPLSWATQR